MWTLRTADPRQLAALVAVVDAGTFTAAAEQLGFTQSAISQQIRQLERAAGVALFDRPRGPRPAELTTAGRMVLEHARSVLARIDRMDEQLELLRRGLAGRLVVGTFQSASAELLPNMLARMRADTPEVDVRLFETDDLDELVGNVLTDEADLAFTVDVADDPRLTIEELGHDPFVVLAPLGAAPGPTVRADDLRGQPLVGQPDVETVQRMVDERLQQAGIVADYAFRFRNNAAVQTMVRTGMGWAVMPSLAVDHDDPDIGIHRLRSPAPTTRHPTDPQARALAATCGRSVQGNRCRGRARAARTMSTPSTTSEVMQLPAVRLLLVSTATAAIGQNVLLTVLFKQVFDLTGNPLDIAFIGLAQFVPALLLVLVSGWVADRFDRRRVAGLFLGGRGVCALALIVFSVRGSETVWQLFLIAFVLGTADAMLAPARRSVAPFVAPQRLFPSVIALWTATFTASAIIGPITGRLRLQRRCVVGVRRRCAPAVRRRSSRCSSSTTTGHPSGSPTARRGRARSKGCTSCVAPPSCSRRSRSTCSPCCSVERSPSSLRLRRSDSVSATSDTAGSAPLRASARPPWLCGSPADH